MARITITNSLLEELEGSYQTFISDEISEFKDEYNKISKDFLEKEEELEWSYEENFDQLNLEIKKLEEERDANQDKLFKKAFKESIIMFFADQGIEELTEDELHIISNSCFLDQFNRMFP